MSRAPSATPEQVDKIVGAQVEAMVRSAVLRHDERSAVQLFQEASYLGVLQNRRYTLGVPETGKGAAPNPLGEGNIDRVSTMKLSKLDKAKDEAVLDWTTTFDAENMKAVGLQVARQQIEAAAIAVDKKTEALKALDAEFATAKVSRNDTGKALIRPSNGWVARLENVSRSETVMKSSSTSNTEKTILIEVSPKSR